MRELTLMANETMASKKLKLSAGDRMFDGVFRRKRAFAFLKVFLSVFCVLAFLGALSIKDFETTTALDISVSARDPESFFKQIIREEIGDQQLTRHIVASQNDSMEFDANVDLSDLDAIRDAFDFRIAKRTNCNQYRLTAAYIGHGTKAEKQLTQNIVSSLAGRLGTSESVETAFDKVGDSFQTIQEKLESNASVVHQELQSANKMIDDLNVGLSEIHESVESIRPDNPDASEFGISDEVVVSALDRERFNELLESLEGKIAAIKSSTDERELHHLGLAVSRIYSDLRELDLPNLDKHDDGSMRIINAAMTESNTAVKAVLELLDELDTDSIQTKIGQLQNNLRVDTIQMREDLVDLQQLTNNLTESRYVVNSVSDTITKPGQSAPHAGHVFLFGCLAIGVGIAVAGCYRPELEDRGFASEETAAQFLGIPIVASLTSKQDSQNLNEGWANSLVRYCEIGLFGFVLLTVILCFIQPDLRAAFFESPFYGLAKLKDLFF